MCIAMSFMYVHFVHLQSGWTPLLISSSAGHDGIVASLLHKDADPNTKNADGQTALHYAASRNRFNVSIFL